MTATQRFCTKGYQPAGQALFVVACRRVWGLIRQAGWRPVVPSPLGLLEKHRNAAQERVDRLEEELAEARVVLERRAVAIKELVETLAPQEDASAGSSGAETVAVPVKGSRVPVWREGLDPVLALAEDYRRLLEAVEVDGGEETGLGVRELTVAVGWDPVPSRTESLRSKASHASGDLGWTFALGSVEGTGIGA